MKKIILIFPILIATKIFGQDTITVFLRHKSLLKTDIEYSLVAKENPSIQNMDIISGKVEIDKIRFTIGFYNSNSNELYNDKSDKFLIGLYNENDLYIDKNVDDVKEKENIFRIDSLLFEIVEVNSLKKYCRLTIKKNASAITKIDFITQLPSFIVKTGNDKKTSSKYLLADGKPCILLFWADWCSNSISELLKIDALYKQYHEKINFIGINGDSDIALSLKTIVTKYKLNWPQISINAEIIHAFKENERYPTSLLFDEKGYLISNYVKHETVRKYLSKNK